MEQSKSLHTLLEVADLMAMVDELLQPERAGELSPASWAGVRITLRASRDRLLESHENLSRSFVQSARGREGISGSSPSGASSSNSTLRPLVERTTIVTTDDGVTAKGMPESGRDLKTALERFTR